MRLTGRTEAAIRRLQEMDQTDLEPIYELAVMAVLPGGRVVAELLDSLILEQELDQ